MLFRSGGNWLWAKRAGSDEGSERGNRVITNSTGDVFFTGEYQDTAKFGSQITLITNNIEVFVACVDKDGNWKWVLNGGSPNEDRGNSLTIDEQCNLYTCGYYELTAAFGIEMITAQGSKDIFVSKILRACQLEPYEISGEILVPTG